MWSEFGTRAASTPSCVQRYRDHLLAHLLCPGRHTVTSLITTQGSQFADWTAHYDLYAQGRVDPQVLFRGVRSHVEALNGPQAPLTVALDDTILRKTGGKIPGAAYRKDPLGPPFNINLVWAQRMIQFSAALPGPDGQVRMIPIDFVDASTPRKPRQNEPEDIWSAYRESMKQRNLNKRAIDTLERLQANRQGPQDCVRPRRRRIRHPGDGATTTFYVSLAYFRDDDPFADWVIHEAAHVFHNWKRDRAGLPHTRTRQFLLEIAYNKREVFAYACEAYARILEQANSPADRRRLHTEYAAKWVPTCDG